MNLFGEVLELGVEERPYDGSLYGLHKTSMHKNLNNLKLLSNCLL